MLIVWSVSKASECPDVKNYKWRLNPVWHRMLYSCTHMATVGFKGLTQVGPSAVFNVSDAASWREGGGGVRQNCADDDQATLQTPATNKSPSSAVGEQLYSPHQYPAFPPYMTMRPGLKPPVMGPVPFHMPMMPPNYNAAMMHPFVRIISVLKYCCTVIYCSNR